MKKLGQKGFTLVELAIVLVIIGILLAGILKGQQMIENAKIKNVINQANGLTAAVYAYQDRYGYLPGDDPRATSHSGFSGTRNGNGDGDLGDRVGGRWEFYLAPQHLSLAGLVTGSYNGVSQTFQHKFGGNVYLVPASRWGVTIPGFSHKIRFDNLPGKVAEAIDTALDDGIWNRGSVRGNINYRNTTVPYFGIGL
jgi:prepilin-type N-terminal cleavage/methylation domain-containing protein